ncbi:MAG: putative metal-binding motif-containing protein, partial [Candidatus Omnitrophica bacterium]|nr:putative metal-binding motif-containing protein [Candidatus Omnitrophota bacterium]
MTFKKIIALGIALSHILMVSLPSPAFAAEFFVFQKTYVRDKGTPETVEDAFGVLNVDSDWILRVVNGSLEDDEVEKVSSSTITLNGNDVLLPNQLNRNINLVESPISVSSLNTVETQLRSKLGGQLTVSIIGQDNNPPAAQWSAPQANAVFNSSNVFAQLNLSDDISGLDPQSFHIFLGDDEITPEFSPFIQPALSVTLQTNLNLADGVHTLSTQIDDLAGNQAQASVTFSVVTDPNDIDQDGDGFSPNAGDCDDQDLDVYPGADEVCNGIDDNCD